MSCTPRRLRTPSGFTLIEILVAILILSVFCILAWDLLAGWMGKSVVGIWRHTANKQLEVASATLRQDITAGSYPAKITPEDNEVAQREDFFLTICGPTGYTGPDWEGDDWAGWEVATFGPAKTGARDAAEVPVLEIVQSNPGRARVPGFPDVAVTSKKVTYYLADGANVFGREKYCQALKDLWVREETGSSPAEAFTSDSTLSFSGGRQRKLVQGINEILVGVRSECLSGGKSQPTSYPSVKVKLLCVEPSDGKAKLSVVVSANPQTGVRFQ